MSPPPPPPQVDKDAVRDMSAAVSSILERVNGASTRQLIMLSSSSKCARRGARSQATRQDGHSTSLAAGRARERSSR